MPPLDFASTHALRALHCAPLALALTLAACGSRGVGGESAQEVAPASETAATTPFTPGAEPKKLEAAATKPDTTTAIFFPQPRVIPASEHPGLRANKVVRKLEPLSAQGAPKLPLPPVSLEIQRKQAAYLAAWENQRASLSNADAAEQDRGRAELKRKVLGQ